MHGVHVLRILRILTHGRRVKKPIDQKSAGSLKRWSSYSLLVASFAGAGLVTWALMHAGGTTREAAWMGGIFVLAVALWVTEDVVNAARASQGVRRAP